MPKASLLVALAATLIAGCGSNGHTDAGQLTPRQSQELRFAAEQASLTCKTGVVKWNLRTARRECEKRTPAELDTAVREVVARCHGGPEVFIGEHFVKCVKR